MPNYVVNTIKIDGPEKDIVSVLDLIRNKDSSSNEVVDFNNVIPMPESLDLVSGSCDKDYVAMYLKTLSDKERMSLASKFSEIETSFYGNYFNKYKESFDLNVSEESLTYLKERLNKDFKSINPSSVEDVGKAYVNNILQYGADTWYDWCCNNWGTKWNASGSYINEGGFGFETAWSAALYVTAVLSEKFPDVKFTHEYADEDIGYNCGRVVLKAGEVVEAYLPEKGSEEAVRFACELWDYDPEEFLEEDYGVDSVDEVIQDATAQSLEEQADKNDKEEALEI